MAPDAEVTRLGNPKAIRIKSPLNSFTTNDTKFGQLAAGTPRTQRKKSSDEDILRTL
jgi:hypothetical protein